MSAVAILALISCMPSVFFSPSFPRISVLPSSFSNLESERREVGRAYDVSGLGFVTAIGVALARR